MTNYYKQLTQAEDRIKKEKELVIAAEAAVQAAEGELAIVQDNEIQKKAKSKLIARLKGHATAARGRATRAVGWRADLGARIAQATEVISAEGRRRDKAIEFNQAEMQQVLAARQTKTEASAEKEEQRKKRKATKRKEAAQKKKQKTTRDPPVVGVEVAAPAPQHAAVVAAVPGGQPQLAAAVGMSAALLAVQLPSQQQQQQPQQQQPQQQQPQQQQPQQQPQQQQPQQQQPQQQQPQAVAVDTEMEAFSFSLPKPGP